MDFRIPKFSLLKPAFFYLVLLFVLYVYTINLFLIALALFPIIFLILLLLRRSTLFYEDKIIILTYLHRILLSKREIERSMIDYVYFQYSNRDNVQSEHGGQIVETTENGKTIYKIQFKYDNENSARNKVEELRNNGVKDAFYKKKNI